MIKFVKAAALTIFLGLAPLPLFAQFGPGNGFSPLQAFILRNAIASATNDNAPTGGLGEVVTQSVFSGSAVSLTSTTTANITSISLTPGDWDVDGVGCFVPAGTTTVQALQGAVSTTSATLPTSGANGRFTHVQPSAVLTTANPCYSIDRVRVSIANTTTVFLVEQATFGTSTLTGYGTIYARRAR